MLPKAPLVHNSDSWYLWDKSKIARNLDFMGRGNGRWKVNAVWNRPLKNKVKATALYSIEKKGQSTSGCVGWKDKVFFIINCSFVWPQLVARTYHNNGADLGYISHCHVGVLLPAQVWGGEKQNELYWPTVHVLDPALTGWYYFFCLFETEIMKTCLVFLKNIF